MRSIGGYFELEIMHIDNFPINGGVYVNSGRNALEYILRCIGIDNIGIIYVPHYTCDAIFKKLRNIGIGFKSYNIDENLEIIDIPELKKNDYIIVNNYFGIKDQYIDALKKKLKEHLIIDNSQAFFYPTSLGDKSFYSIRKFCGVPDGGVAWTTGEYDIPETDHSFDRFMHLLKRRDCGATYGYEDYKKNEHIIEKLELAKISNLTNDIISSLNFDDISMKRKANYDTLRHYLERYNLLNTPESTSIACPMVYPFRTKDMKIRDYLIENEIFVPTYWPNVISSCQPEKIEYKLASEILPLPIDQRYGIDDMRRIINVINEYGH